jgi:hypothetical protein
MATTEEQDLDGERELPGAFLGARPHRPPTAGVEADATIAFVFSCNANLSVTYGADDVQ